VWGNLTSGRRNEGAENAKQGEKRKDNEEGDRGTDGQQKC